MSQKYFLKCKDCKDRKVLCQKTCKFYLDDKAKYDEEKKSIDIKKRVETDTYSLYIKKKAAYNKWNRKHR